jgi:hypothetical protein
VTLLGLQVINLGLGAVHRDLPGVISPGFQGVALGLQAALGLRAVDQGLPGVISPGFQGVALGLQAVILDLQSVILDLQEVVPLVRPTSPELAYWPALPELR